jgi:acetyl/propionyl-CoA carboxylase alpha subunit
MFKRVLIANRGEIACRIAATLREMQIRSVAVCSEADRGARHVRLADEMQVIGPAEARASYLDVPAVLRAARATGAEAIHPGYGFLAENATFAQAVEEAGLVFIGPTAEQIRALGDKRMARAVAERAGLPVVPGAKGDDEEQLVGAAKKIGYPVFLKAALGGGGKGMTVAADETALRASIQSTRRLAVSGFGDDSLYLEKGLERPRHIEVQIAGDGQGKAIHLFERECSLQRRRQKVVEETPAPNLDPALRERLAEMATAVAREARYRGLGTVEFLVEPKGGAYFLEMNTRLQVEHPVTELVTGLDLVRLQVELAATSRLGVTQDQVALRGHAAEARVYAEDPLREFLPQAGRAVRVHWPRAPFVRVDAGIGQGDPVPVHYDPILAKIVAWAPSRPQALERLTQALDEAMVHGLATNLPFLRALLRASEVRAGRFDTEWIERDFLPGFVALANSPAPELAVAAAALAEAAEVTTGMGKSGRSTVEDPFQNAGRWRLPGL